MNKTKYCPSCGSTDLQIEGARHEGRYAGCFDCGWGDYANRVRYERPKRAKPPCEHLIKISGGDLYQKFECGLEVCVHPKGDKTVSCFLHKRKFAVGSEGR